MRTSSLYGTILGVVLLLASCQNADVKMHTIVYKDGHCEREVSYSAVMSKEARDTLWHGDTLGMALPIPACIDSSVFKKTKTEVVEDTVTTTCYQAFHSVEEMSRQMPLLLNDTRLQSSAKLEKRFRWFYSEYTFTEVFRCVGDTFKLAVTDYVDKDVASYWFTGQPDLIQGLSGAEASEKLEKMESSISKWLNDNVYQECFDFIVSHYDSIPHPPVSRERFIEMHDTLSNFLLKGHENLLEEKGAEAFQSFFHSDAYAMFFDEETPCGKAMYEELFNKLSIFGFSVPYSLTMPGNVVDAGNGEYRDGIIYYPLTGERLIPHDYTISATSRVINIWAFIVTLLIIVLAIISWYHHMTRSRRK